MSGLLSYFRRPKRAEPAETGLIQDSLECTPQTGEFHNFKVPRRQLTRCCAAASLLHMKRTNLVLDGELLDEATRLSGERTYSAAVNRALTDFVKRARSRQILDLAGSGLWVGDLAEMRDDRSKGRGRRAARGSR